MGTVDCGELRLWDNYFVTNRIYQTFLYYFSSNCWLDLFMVMEPFFRFHLFIAVDNS